MEVSGQLHALTTFFSGKEPAVPVEEEAGWNPEAVWMDNSVQKKNLLPVQGIRLKFSWCPVHILVTTLAEHPWLPQ